MYELDLRIFCIKDLDLNNESPMDNNIVALMTDAAQYFFKFINNVYCIYCMWVYWKDLFIESIIYYSSKNKAGVYNLQVLLINEFEI